MQADYVGVLTVQRTAQLGALAFKLKGLAGISAAAVKVGIATAGATAAIAGGCVKGQEEVERVHRCDTQAATNRFRLGWSWVGFCIGGWPGRVDTIEVEIKAKDPDCILDQVTTTEAIRQRERSTIGMAQDRWI